MEILDLMIAKGSKPMKPWFGVPVPKDRYHLVIHICIFNHKGEMLIQNEAIPKQTARSWDVSVGGAVQQQYQLAASPAELEEELGISFDFSQIRPSSDGQFAGGRFLSAEHIRSPIAPSSGREVIEVMWQVKKRSVHDRRKHLSQLSSQFDQYLIRNAFHMILVK